MAFDRDRQQLISNFLEGKEGDFLKAHSGLVDAYFQASYEKSLIGPRMVSDKNPFALVALGGYGREEQCIHSDIDLLLLFEKTIPDEAEGLVQEMLYPLWDMGQELGYATRTIRDCIGLAKQDVEALLPLLDARPIAGMSPLYTLLMQQIQKQIVRKQSKEIISWLAAGSQARHERYGDSTYLLEPNLKEGQGGLRDYHAMRWVANIRSGLVGLRDFVYNGYLSDEELSALEEALRFIWHVRNHLHNLSKRRNDQLYFEHQMKLAEALQYEKADGQEPVEKFLGELHGKMELVKQQHLMLFYEIGQIKAPESGKKVRRRTRMNGLTIEKGRMLSYTAPEGLLGSPHLLIKVFEESARLYIPLSASAKRLVVSFMHLVDDAFRTSPLVVRSLERILLAPATTFNVLNEMLNTGLLVKLIPEIQGIVNRIQYNEYHLYPVDKHSLRVIQTIKRFNTPALIEEEPLWAQLYGELKKPKLLLWAALLHDIGKGVSNRDHAKRGADMARGVMSRIGYKKGEIETVVFLVAEHLLLARTATRRDISDEETAIVCARRIGNPDRAKMLYLLTVADSMATGPKAWSSWKASLLKTFFLKIVNILDSKELATPKAVNLVEAKQTRLLDSATSDRERSEMESLMKVMSPRYLLYESPENILSHIALYNGLGEGAFVWDISRSGGSNIRKATICATDRPGLFSNIAGVFTLNNVNILSAQVFTWRNNVALDIFEVTPPPDRLFEDERWDRAKEDLRDALSGRLDLSKALDEKMAYRRSTLAASENLPSRVVIDNESSSFFTIVDVFAYDFPGLLYSITDALYKCGLDIWIAKIATQVDQVVDAFYVRDLDGEKVDDPEKTDEIKRTILQVLSGRNSTGENA